jgi:PAS domain S-box-containing protein
MQAEVQQVAEAVAAALGVEVEIVDETLTVVGGTGKYLMRVGLKEEEGRKENGYVYGRVLTTGLHFIIPEPQKDPAYDQSVLEGTTEELAEICTPIKLEGRLIGVIGLVAFTQEQRARILQEPNHMLAFVQRMADLLASRILADTAHKKLVQATGHLQALIAAIHDGILSVDLTGQVTHWNSAAEALLGLRREELLYRPVEEVLPGAGLAGVLSTGQGFADREEVLTVGGRTVHLVLTVTAIEVDGLRSGAVVVLRDIRQVRRLVYNLALENQSQSFADIKGESPAIRSVLDQAKRIAHSQATVLITGESGTGKDLLARAIHFQGSRRHGPFIALNCGALPESLLESELFGYVAGAFTGALKSGKPGKFELADGGTIFLDEIGDLPLHLQVKLLHVLQRREVERVGGTRTIPVSVRVIAATNRSPEQMVKEGQFRSDLFFRLNVIPLHMPPLRDRPEDIPLLLRHFLQVHAKRLGRASAAATPDAHSALRRYGWPGNIRELENAVEYAVNVATGDEIGLDCLPPWLGESRNSGRDGVEQRAFLMPAAGGSLREQVTELERQVLVGYLETYGRGGEVIDRIGRELNLSRATLYRKLNRLGLLGSLLHTDSRDR